MVSHALTHFSWRQVSNAFCDYFMSVNVIELPYFCINVELKLIKFSSYTISHVKDIILGAKLS